MKPVVRLTLLVVFALAALAGCKGTIPISRLLDDPSRYDHQQVRVAGTVGESMGVLGYGAFRINDGTGTLTVVTKGGGAPRQGAHVGIEGEFRSAFTLGAETIAVLLESRRRVE